MHTEQMKEIMSTSLAIVKQDYPQLPHCWTRKNRWWRLSVSSLLTGWFTVSTVVRLFNCVIILIHMKVSVNLLKIHFWLAFNRMLFWRDYIKRYRFLLTYLLNITFIWVVPVYVTLIGCHGYYTFGQSIG